jgi:hypothetical protein
MNERFAVVQIRNYTYSWRKSTPIYFEDSLVASCEAPSNRKKGHEKEIHRLDLKFDRPGILSTLINGSSIYKSGVLLQPGKVYKLSIIPTRYGDRFFRQGNPGAE